MGMGLPRMHLGEGGGARRWEGGEDKERGKSGLGDAGSRLRDYTF